MIILKMKVKSSILALKMWMVWKIWQAAKIQAILLTKNLWHQILSSLSKILPIFKISIMEEK